MRDTENSKPRYAAYRGPEESKTSGGRFAEDGRRTLNEPARQRRRKLFVRLRLQKIGFASIYSAIESDMRKYDKTFEYDG